MPLEPKYQEITVTCMVAGIDNVQPKEVEYHSSHDFGASGYIVRAITENAQTPERGARTQLYINEVPVCGGPVLVSDVSDENVVSFEAFDAQRRLNTWRTDPGKIYSGNAFSIAEQIFTEAGVQFEVTEPDYDNRTDDILSENANIEAFSAKNVPYSDALNKLMKESGGVWYVDGENICRFSVDSPFDNYDLRDVLEFNEGKQSSPWGGVKVIGRAQPHGDGSQMMNSKPIVGYAPIREENREEPIYEYESNDVSDKATAERIARGIYRSFSRQRGTGKAEIVGDSRLRPGDSVGLPAFFENENYGVKSVSHYVNSQDGFKTELQFSGFLGNDRDPLPSN